MKCEHCSDDTAPHGVCLPCAGRPEWCRVCGAALDWAGECAVCDWDAA